MEEVEEEVIHYAMPRHATQRRGARTVSTPLRRAQHSTAHTHTLPAPIILILPSIFLSCFYLNNKKKRRKLDRVPSTHTRRRNKPSDGKLRLDGWHLIPFNHSIGIDNVINSSSSSPSSCCCCCCCCCYGQQNHNELDL